MSSEGAVKMPLWCRPDWHHFAGERPLMWGCDEAYTVIRKCKGRMNSVSERHRSDLHCRRSDIPQPCKSPLHPACITDIRAVCTHSGDKWQWKSLCDQTGRAPISAQFVLYCCLLLCRLPDTVLIHASIKSALLSSPLVIFLQTKHMLLIFFCKGLDRWLSYA